MAPVNVGTPGPRKGALAHRIVAATDVAVTITVATNRHFVMIQNIGTKVAYIGATNVTTASFSAYLTPRQTYDFGYVSSGFTVGVITATTEQTNIGVTEHA